MKNEESKKPHNVKYFLRIITDCCARETEQKVSTFLRSLHGITDFHMDPIAPYRKYPVQGEVQVSFLSARPMAEMQALLADHWEGEVADARWSCILVPHAVFIWLTRE